MAAIDLEGCQVPAAGEGIDRHFDVILVVMVHHVLNRGGRARFINIVGKEDFDAFVKSGLPIIR
jgi:hypothetical protein